MPTAIIPAFDAYLAARGLAFEAIVIGGSARNLLGVLQRPIEDCDVLDPDIPPTVRAAAEACATELDLGTGWLNSHAHDFVGVPGCLPERWRARLQPAYLGKARRLQTLGRHGLLCMKQVALVERGLDYPDCLALRPTRAELEQASPFVAQYEGNPDSRDAYWLPLARRQLSRLAKELGYDVVL